VGGGGVCTIIKIDDIRDSVFKVKDPQDF
jgi:hypothetical protein